MQDTQQFIGEPPQRTALSYVGKTGSTEKIIDLLSWSEAEEHGHSE